MTHRQNTTRKYHDPSVVLCVFGFNHPQTKQGIVFSRGTALPGAECFNTDAAMRALLDKLVAVDDTNQVQINRAVQEAMEPTLKQLQKLVDSIVSPETQRPQGRLREYAGSFLAPPSDPGTSAAIHKAIDTSASARDKIMDDTLKPVVKSAVFATWLDPFQDLRGEKPSRDAADDKDDNA